MRTSDRRPPSFILRLLVAGIGAIILLAAPAMAAGPLHFGVTTETLTVDPAALDPAAFDAIFPSPPASGAGGGLKRQYDGHDRHPLVRSGPRRRAGRPGGDRLGRQRDPRPF